MRNPTSKAFDYRGEIYMGTDLAKMSEQQFHLNSGEEKQVSFPITMPTAPGTYPVHIGVFSEGANIKLYRAVEDVTIVALNRFEYACCDNFRHAVVSGFNVDLVRFNWKVASVQYPVDTMRGAVSVQGTQWSTLFSGAFYASNEGSYSDYCTMGAHTAGITASGIYPYRVEMTAYHWTGTQLIEIATVIYEGQIQYTR